MTTTELEIFESGGWIYTLCQLKPSVLLTAAAMACYDVQQYQITISILELCITLETGNPTAYLVLGQSLLALNQPEKAILALEHSLALDPDSVEAKSLLLFCYTSTPS